MQNEQTESTPHQITKIAIVALVLALGRNPFQEGYPPKVPTNHMPSSEFEELLWPLEAIKGFLKTIPLKILAQGHFRLSIMRKSLGLTN